MALTREDNVAHGVHSCAAKLTERIIRDYIALLGDGGGLCGILQEWRALMRAFRQMERETMIERVPEIRELESHVRCMNAMILCADTILQVCQRHLEINFPANDGVPGEMTPLVELVRRQRGFLAFEFKGWSPLPAELARKAEMGLLSDPRRKAA